MQKQNIRMLRTRVLGVEHGFKEPLTKGQEYMVPVSLAESLIRKEIAEPVDTQEHPPAGDETLADDVAKTVVGGSAAD